MKYARHTYSWALRILQSLCIHLDPFPILAEHVSPNKRRRICIIFSDTPRYWRSIDYEPTHYNDVIMGSMTYQITSLTIVYPAVYSGADQRKHQSSASLVFVRAIHRGPMNSPRKWPVTRKMFPFDDVIMPCESPHKIIALCNRQPVLGSTHGYLLLHFLVKRKGVRRKFICTHIFRYS